MFFLRPSLPVHFWVNPSLGAILNEPRWLALALDAFQEAPEAMGRIEFDGGR